MRLRCRLWLWLWLWQAEPLLPLLPLRHLWMLPHPWACDGTCGGGGLGRGTPRRVAHTLPASAALPLQWLLLALPLVLQCCAFMFGHFGPFSNSADSIASLCLPTLPHTRGGPYHPAKSAPLPPALIPLFLRPPLPCGALAVLREALVRAFFLASFRRCATSICCTSRSCEHAQNVRWRP